MKQMISTDCIISFPSLLPPLTAPPPSVTINGPSTIPAGQTVVLVCNVSRDVIVTWSRDDGRPLPNAPDGNVLHIEMPQAEDGGVYRCSAGGVVAMFNLVVMEPPTTASEEAACDVIMKAHAVYSIHVVTVTHWSMILQ